MTKESQYFLDTELVINDCRIKTYSKESSWKKQEISSERAFQKYFVG